MHVWAEPRESTVVLRPACMDPAGKTLIVPSEHAVAIADVKPRGAPLVMMDISESEPVSPEPRSLEFTAGGDRLLVLSKDGSARIKRTGTGGVVSTLRHGGRIDHATFTRDGKRVVTVVANDGVHVRDGVTGRLIMRLAAHAGGLYSVACSPDGRFIAAAGEHGRAYVWDAESGALRHELQRHNVSIGHVAFSQDSAFVVTAADDRTARVWSVDTGTPVQVCTAADERITYSMSQFAMFEPAGRMLLTARLNRGAQLWDVVSGALLKEFRAERGGPVDAIVHATFSPDGTRLVTADSEGWATIWNCVTLEKELDLSCHSEEIDGVEFSPDGHRLLTYSWRARDARLWDAVTGQELVEYATYGSHVSAGALSPDGTRIAIGTEDGLVRLWTTLPRRQALIDLGRTVVPRALTDDERRQFFMTHASSAG
jgi:WD40 repeat protein